jgi:hypothetical protein
LKDPQLTALIRGKSKEDAKIPDNRHGTVVLFEADHGGTVNRFFDPD